MKRIFLAALSIVIFAVGLAAEEPKELATAKKEFEKIEHPDEAARVHYVLSLAKLREKLARSNGNWQAVDGELKQHPAPKDADTKVLTKLRAGAWTSPRHDYLYRKDGTWVMTPDEPESPRGHWHIEGNQITETSEGKQPGPASTYTIILLNEKNFICTDGEMVFYETRKGK